MRLYFIRHGQSHINVADESQWHTLETMDTELTDKGHRQAAALGEWLRQNNVKADALYCSTMRRARQTAYYVSEAINLEPTFDDRLREIGSNYIGGLAIEEERLPRKFVSHWPHIAPFTSRALDTENVESWMHFRVRLATFIDDLHEKHTNQDVYIVAHGGVVAAMFDNIFNIGPYRRCGVFSHNTGLTLFRHRIEHRQELWMMDFHNRIDHLTDPELL